MFGTFNLSGFFLSSFCPSVYNLLPPKVLFSFGSLCFIFLLSFHVYTEFSRDSGIEVLFNYPCIQADLCFLVFRGVHQTVTDILYSDLM